MSHYNNRVTKFYIPKTFCTFIMSHTKVEIVLYILLFVTLLHISFFVWNNDSIRTTTATVISSLFNETSCSEQCQETCGNDLDCEKDCISKSCPIESQNG